MINLAESKKEGKEKTKGKKEGIVSIQEKDIGVEKESNLELMKNE